MSKHKCYTLASFKALPDEGGQTGRFEAIVSVFGNTDHAGDRVVKGAFKKSLERWREAGKPIPVIWSHDWADPFAHIGVADPMKASETDAGLKVVGRLDVDKPFAAQVYDLLKDGRVKEWSFSYEVLDKKTVDKGVNELRELDIIEVGPTLKGMNPSTATLGVKSALAAAASKDVYTTMPGSQEEQRAHVQAAISEWAEGKFPAEEGQYMYASVSATFDDRVIVTVRTGEDEPTTWEIPYDTDADGKVSLGEPAEVDLSVAVVQKSAGVKHGSAPTHLQAAHDSLVRAGAKCSTSGDEGGDEDEDKSGEPKSLVRETMRLKLDALLTDADV